MIDSLQVFDMVLALAIVTIAMRLLWTPDLFQSMVLFIVFGLTLTIAWCRLDAVDVALAEAAIGAGLTGALLLNTLAATRGRDPDATDATEPRGDSKQAVAATAGPLPPVAAPLRPAAAFGFCATTMLLAAALSTVVVPLTRSPEAPRIAIDQALSHSGAQNPVTAVLLNFRAYDTLLEVFVLLVAVIAVFPATLSVGDKRAGTVGPVLRTFATLLVPLTVLVATYVLWIGTKAPGGAFQAAAMFAAGGVFLIVCGARPPSLVQKRWRLVLVGGLVVFLLVGFGGIAWGGRFLEFRPPWAGPWIMVIETVLAGSTALILLLLFCGTSPDEVEHTGFQPSGNPCEKHGI